MILYSKATDWAARKRLSDVLALAALLFRFVPFVLFKRTICFDTYPPELINGISSACDQIAVMLSFLTIALSFRHIRLQSAVLVGLAVMALSLSAGRRGDYYFVDDFVVLMALSTVDPRKSCRAYYLAIGIVIAAVITSASLSLVYNRGIVPNGRLVFRYGFTHPNQLGVLLFGTLVAMLYVHWEGRWWTMPAILAVLVAVFSYFILSAHAIGVMCLTLAVTAVICHSPARTLYQKVSRKLYGTILVVVPLVLFLGMSACTALYDEDSPLMVGLSRLLHSRPRLSHRYYSLLEGFTMLGRSRYDGYELRSDQLFFSLDSGYSNFALVFGILSFIALYIAYAMAVSKMCTEGQYPPVIWVSILLYAVYLVAENCILRAAMNPTLMVLACALFTVKNPCPNGVAARANRLAANMQ